MALYHCYIVKLAVRQPHEEQLVFKPQRLMRFELNISILCWYETESSLIAGVLLVTVHHVGQDVQLPAHWGHLLPIRGRVHQWLHQHIRVRLTVRSGFVTTGRVCLAAS